MKKILALILALCMACSLAACEISIGSTADESSSEVTEAATEEETEDETEEETEEDEDSSDDDSTDSKLLSDQYSDGSAPEDVVDASDISSPAEVGDWVETKVYCAVDSAYHTVYARVTEIKRGAEDDVDEYNSNAKAVTLSDLDDDNLEYCLISYEVYFPEDFPQKDYGITSTTVDFSISSVDGGAIKADDNMYVGLSTTWDISEEPESNTFYAGSTFEDGKAVFAMVKNFSDYVIEITYREDGEEYVQYIAGE